MTLEEENLEIMKKANNYNKWIYDNIKNDIGISILEIGSGIGAMTKFIDNNSVCCVDINSKHIRYLNKKYIRYPNISVVKTDLSKRKHKISKTFDTVICINILEHVKDDKLMLSNIYSLLENNGRLILVLPAYSKLYGTIDKSDNHYRRYDKKDIEDFLLKFGYKIQRIQYMNMPGYLGWWYHGKFLKLKIHNENDIGLFNTLVPLFKLIEKIIKPWFGLSLIVICGVNK